MRAEDEAGAWRVVVRPLGEDARGARLARDARAQGFAGVTRASVERLVVLDGALARASVERLVEEVLWDAVVESVEVCRWAPGAPERAPESSAWTVEVLPLPGVTDTQAEALAQVAGWLGLGEGLRAATGRRVTLWGALGRGEAEALASQVVANGVVERWALQGQVRPPWLDVAQAARGVAERVRVRGLTDEALVALGERRRLALDVAELRAIAAWFEAQGRDPTDVELETLAQTWSEHCAHKTFRAKIVAHEVDGAGEVVREQVIDGLLETYIRGATEAIGAPWVRSAFVDNAGRVALDARYEVAVKVETHNHPSALEPFGGAHTGIGGVVRDILGVSARPIATTDVLCFGPQELPRAALPEGVLHPVQVARGVVSGVEDYGNTLGLATVNGAVVYDTGYTCNPLVYCGSVGVLPQGAHPVGARVGDRVVVVGGRTGRDGLRGATFSSMGMSHETGAKAGSVVQIGDPKMEKQVIEAVLQARDAGLYHAITDCGAGGLSSAVGELGAMLGVRVALERVPLKYAGLEPWEVWLSEAQERMVLAVAPEDVAAVAEVCALHGVEATELGAFTGDGWMVLTYGGREVGRLSMDLLYRGAPRRELAATWRVEPTSLEVAPCAAPSVDDLGAALLGVLADPDVRSREAIVRRYDHEVQGGTWVKPLVGRGGRGHGDGAVLVPLEVMRAAREAGEAPVGIALGAGIVPRYGERDPYAMARAAVDEAVRNVVAVGADPDRVALLDNFCWGDPLDPEVLGALVRCAQGCFDGACAMGAPFVSGKDSLNNTYVGRDGLRRSIPGTLLVSAVGRVPNAAQTTTSAFKRPGGRVYVVGATWDELGASIWARGRGWGGGRVPRAREGALALARRVHAAIRCGWVRACHDCSDGGLLAAVAEMALGGELGARVRLGDVPVGELVGSDVAVAFGESLARYVVEVDPDDVEAWEQHMRGLPFGAIGEVCAAPELRVWGVGGGLCVEVTLGALGRAWRGEG